ncbi:tetratricopeptide repeat protein [Peribacillus frigoritolerans]|nr:tetratricopeptide repeat protein [Peribacillus frigoritolerans]
MIKKDIYKARDYYEKAIESNPDLHEAHYNLALVYMNLESFDQAKEQADKAIELAPDNKSYTETTGRNRKATITFDAA